MKLITNKKYKKLMDNYADPFSSFRTYKEHCEILKKELEQAKDLKTILEELKPLKKTISALSGSINFSGSEITLPDNVLIYVDDILGGKVIKQEANKCIIISEKGDVTTGLTKKKNDKGYSYKLVQE